MTQYDNTNRGALFKNDRKQQDNHPDYTGSINVGGAEYWLSAWLKDGQKGKFFSMSIKPKDEQQRQAPANPRAAQSQARRPDPISSGRNADMDDDSIPF
ncbi:hypothetical protein ACVIYH_009078 [Bradyrhizobium diazoefficiens]